MPDSPSIAAVVTELLENSYWRALVAILLSLALAKIVDRVISVFVVRMTRRTRTDADDRLVALLHGPIFWSVVLFGVYWALVQLRLPELAATASRRVIQTVALLLWIRAILGSAAILLREAADRQVSFLERRSLPLFDNFTKLLLFGAAVYFLMVVWGVNAGPWLATAGIGGIAIGFAAQDTLANLFSGIFIMADAPYKIGDYIVLDGQERGKVTQIGLRSTRILTRDDVEVILPNSAIAAAKIVNESGGPSPQHRITLRVGVAYGSDVDLVREVLLDSASKVGLVCSAPGPRVRFTEFGDSSLLFRLLCWIEEPVARGRCLDELHTMVYKRFADEGIRIAFPHLDVKLRPSDA